MRIEISTRDYVTTTFELWDGDVLKARGFLKADALLRIAPDSDGMRWESELLFETLRKTGRFDEQAM